MKVYVADHGLVKTQDGINIRTSGLVLETHPAAKYADRLRLLGETDAAGVAEIEMWGDAATLPALRDRIRITPNGAAGSDPGATRAIPPRRRRGRPPGTREVTKAEIVAKFRELRTAYGRAPTQPELAANVERTTGARGIEIRTLQDHLKAYVLPWPIE